MNVDCVGAHAGGYTMTVTGMVWYGFTSPATSIVTIYVHTFKSGLCNASQR